MREEKTSWKKDQDQKDLFYIIHEENENTEEKT
jgi:hypothetical protein